MTEQPAGGPPDSQGGSAPEREGRPEEAEIQQAKQVAEEWLADRERWLSERAQPGPESWADQPERAPRRGGHSEPAQRGRSAEPTRRAGRAEPGRQPGPPRGSGMPGGDLMAEFQRWLIRSSARNLRREISGQVRRSIVAERPADVWSTVTTEAPPGEATQAPECAWCPICRAARRMRDAGPGLGSQLSSAGGAVAVALGDVVGTVNAVLSGAGSGQDKPEQRTRPAAPGSEEPQHEPDDRG
jgi:hypothetical protein